MDGILEKILSNQKLSTKKFDKILCEALFQNEQCVTEAYPIEIIESDEELQTVVIVFKCPRDICNHLMKIQNKVSKKTGNKDDTKIKQNEDTLKEEKTEEYLSQENRDLSTGNSLEQPNVDQSETISDEQRFDEKNSSSIDDVIDDSSNDVKEELDNANTSHSENDKKSLDSEKIMDPNLKKTLKITNKKTGEDQGVKGKNKKGKFPVKKLKKVEKKSSPTLKASVKKETEASVAITEKDDINKMVDTLTTDNETTQVVKNNQNKGLETEAVLPTKQIESVRKYSHIDSEASSSSEDNETKELISPNSENNFLSDEKTPDKNSEAPLVQDESIITDKSNENIDLTTRNEKTGTDDKNTDQINTGVKTKLQEGSGYIKDGGDLYNNDDTNPDHLENKTDTADDLPDKIDNTDNSSKKDDNDSHLVDKCDNADNSSDKCDDADNSQDKSDNADNSLEKDDNNSHLLEKSDNADNLQDISDNDDAELYGDNFDDYEINLQNQFDGIDTQSKLLAFNEEQRRYINEGKSFLARKCRRRHLRRTASQDVEHLDTLDIIRRMREKTKNIVARQNMMMKHKY